MTMDTTHEHSEPVSYKTITTVWVVLLALTATLVLISRVSPVWAVAAMLTLTPLKAGLVMYYFMHLKYEGTLIKGMVAVALSTLVIFIGMMFLDIAFR
jgi:cytochrome c oxidase subunit 4